MIWVVGRLKDSEVLQSYFGICANMFIFSCCSFSIILFVKDRMWSQYQNGCLNFGKTPPVRSTFCVNWGRVFGLIVVVRTF